MFTPTTAEHASHQGYQCRLSKKQPYGRQFQQRPLKIKAACMLHVHTGSIGRPLF
ncbi:hypothetical protein B484DRAFT_395777 [Ochromonadaceae sp. CCMP2298]|nr:hypothetical protein B484DRAFT_395777 [Ochromonadaceae sp. CCMP2298]